jgi:hypothetical protein
MNVSQCPREAKPSRKMVHTQVDHLAWDRWLSYNPHALTIYFKKNSAREATLERFEEC